ncbi:MAG: hypothetical protein J6V82_01495 [Clostridia bacterium]|nr:hypothetical protein [Clostridia bacterium]MBO7150403.1 hypothetical protein [Clostridia bacterium]
MPKFVDLHTHILSRTDDGALDKEQMYAMLDMAYEDGTRALCATPHYFPKLFGDNTEAADRAFAELVAYSAKYPDFTLYRGNELYYTHENVQAAFEGKCLRIADSRYLLLEFDPDIGFFDMRAALSAVAGRGMFPLLAHTERYTCLYKDPERLELLRAQECACFQVNASSLFGGWGRKCAKFALYLIKRGYASVVASDAHGTEQRKPILSGGYAFVARKFGEATAQMLFYENPLMILENKPLYK